MVHWRHGDNGRTPQAGAATTNNFRPVCPEHPESNVQLDGFTMGWSTFHRRPRYRCMTPAGTRGHVVTLPIPVRTPTDRHPDSGQACPRCEHVLERHEGTKTGADFLYGHTEIAAALTRVGEGDTFRWASMAMRQAIFRTSREHVATSTWGRRAGKVTSPPNTSMRTPM